MVGWVCQLASGFVNWQVALSTKMDNSLFKGTRVPVSALFNNLKGGATIEEFMEWFPGVTRHQVEVVLTHQIESLEKGQHR